MRKLWKTMILAATLAFTGNMAMAVTTIKDAQVDLTTYFKLADSETVAGIPAFNGGTSGGSAPFSVDSTFVVSNLNADLLDGREATYFEIAGTLQTLQQAITTGNEATLAADNVMELNPVGAYAGLKVVHDNSTGKGIAIEGSGSGALLDIAGTGIGYGINVATTQNGSNGAWIDVLNAIPVYAEATSTSDGALYAVQKGAGGALLFGDHQGASGWLVQLQSATTDVFTISKTGLVQADGGFSIANEALDAYDEGTWTPVYDGVTTGTCTTSAAAGFYTKIGNVVNADGVIIVSSCSVTPTGTPYVTLPFAANNTSSYSGSCSFGLINDYTLTALHTMLGYIEHGTSYMSLREYIPAGPDTGTDAPADVAFGMYYHCTYLTD